MRIESMELLGVGVDDFDAAVKTFSGLLGLDFQVFTPGVDYELVDIGPVVEDDQPPVRGRIAMDATGFFEIIEMPGLREGFRNIHFRVDDIEAAIAHARKRGLRVVRDLRAGTVREVIFDGATLHGIRLCFVQYAGASFAAALAASPAAPSV
jgi:catechol 2,3-dioxygenase-like lactoylglutathione lyase family enzyme